MYLDLSICVTLGCTCLCISLFTMFGYGVAGWTPSEATVLHFHLVQCSIAAMQSTDLCVMLSCIV